MTTAKPRMTHTICALSEQSPHTDRGTSTLASSWREPRQGGIASDLREGSSLWPHHFSKALSSGEHMGTSHLLLAWPRWYCPFLLPCPSLLVPVSVLTGLLFLSWSLFCWFLNESHLIKAVSTSALGTSQSASTAHDNFLKSRNGSMHMGLSCRPYMESFLKQSSSCSRPSPPFTAVCLSRASLTSSTWLTLVPVYQLEKNHSQQMSLHMSYSCLLYFFLSNTSLG